MKSLGLRELRQQASDLVRRAESGERLLITVSGRPAAVLGPAGRGHWHSYAEVAELLATPADPDWADDRRRIRDDLADPWARA